MSLVHIHYLRPPDRVTVFRQHLVYDGPDGIVTLLDHSGIAAPAHVHGRVMLEPGAPIVWFTFPGLWHDIGRFHTHDGTFTGIYANILTPVQREARDRWSTTDLFLDVWLDERGPVLLDEDELDDAHARGWVAADTAAQARAEARRLLARAAAGTWPPDIVAEWPLERARAALAGGDGTPPAGAG